MRLLSVVAGIALAAAQGTVGQTRTDLASRFGTPRAETFLLPSSLKLTATYDQQGRACSFRVETLAHSDRAAPNLMDAKYWTDSQDITRLIAELVPDSIRNGPVRSHTMGLRVGEHMRVESDDAVEITRIQRSRPLLPASELPVADRLVSIVFNRPECRTNKEE